FILRSVLKPVGKSAGVDDLAVLLGFDPEDAVADGDGFGQFIGLLGVGFAPGAIGLLGLGVDQMENELAMAGPGVEGRGGECGGEKGGQKAFHTPFATSGLLRKFSTSEVAAVLNSSLGMY